MSDRIIDVSSNNNVTNWNQVAIDGVSQVIVRLSLGYGDMDIRAKDFAFGAQAAGINVGYYHFAYPDKKSTGTNIGDAKSEANYFTGLFQGGMLPQPNFLAVDLEPWDNHGGDSPLTPAQYLEWVLAFLNEVYAATGQVCHIYGNKSYLDSHLPSNHNLGTQPLWLANYNPVTNPPLPRGWTQYTLWQYSESQVVKGINGFCDMSRSYAYIFFKKVNDKLQKKLETMEKNRQKNKKKK